MRAFAQALIAAALSSCPAAAVPAADERGPVVVKDPHYGEVLFHFYQGEYFPAIVRLLAARDTARLDNHLDESELLLGGMYLSHGQPLAASGIFERLLAANVDQDVRDRIGFFLAKIWQQRGYLDKAQQAFDTIEGQLPPPLDREAKLLEAQLLIDGGDYDRAIALLAGWQGKSEWSHYAQFNLGVALLRSGRVEAARRLLFDLGDIDPRNEELRSLRDRANLALGYALLQDGRALAAKPPLRRVRLEGPFSNQALLGAGWADAELENYERSLVTWMELRGRDLLDSAVQESMLAIPYALVQLDALSQAADHYFNAIEAFHEEAGRIDNTIERIESGALLDAFLTENPLDSTGWYWRLEVLPGGPEARYLFPLLATHTFQEGLKNYRDLHYLHRNLDTWQRTVDGYANARRLPPAARERADIEALELDTLAPRLEALKRRVDDSMRRQRAFLQRLAVSELSARKQRLDAYAIQARFALASLYDIAATVSPEASGE